MHEALTDSMTKEQPPNPPTMSQGIPFSNLNRLYGPIRGMDYLSREVPVEVLEKIADYLADDVNQGVAALANLSRTSRGLQRIFEPALYRHELLYDHKGHSVIVWGAKHGKLDVVKKALSYGTHPDTLDITRVQDAAGEPYDIIAGSAIHYAVKGGHDRIVKYLFQRGAALRIGSWGLCDCHLSHDTTTQGTRLNTSRRRGGFMSDGWLPLHLAICQKQTSTAKLLLQLPVPSRMTSSRHPYCPDEPSAIHWAAKAGQHELIALMVEKARRGRKGWTDPKNDEECVIYRQNWIVNQNADWGPGSPMQCAAESAESNKETIKVLFSLGADPKGREKTLHDQPLARALSRGGWDRALALFECGATIGKHDHSPEHSHFLTLARALLPPEPVLLGTALQEWRNAQEQFIRQVVAAYHGPNRQRPVLSISCESYSHIYGIDHRNRLVNLLLELGFDPNASIGKGATALSMCMRGYEMIAQHTNIPRRDLKGSLDGHKACIINLLKHGAEMEPLRSSTVQGCTCEHQNVIHRAINLSEQRERPRVAMAGRNILRVFRKHCQNLRADQKKLITDALIEPAQRNKPNAEVDVPKRSTTSHQSGSLPYCQACYDYFDDCGLRHFVVDDQDDSEMVDDDDSDESDESDMDEDDDEDDLRCACGCEDEGIHEYMNEYDDECEKEYQDECECECECESESEDEDEDGYQDECESECESECADQNGDEDDGDADDYSSGSHGL